MPSADAAIRFDDRISTILASGAATPTARASLWRQLVDMLAQSGNDIDADISARALAALSLLRTQVDQTVRTDSVRSIAARCGFAPLVVLLSNDASPVVAALFDRLQLDAANWIIVLPQIGPLARSRLRRRSDLPLPVHQALARLTPVDYALPDAPTAVAGNVEPFAPPPSPGTSTIADLVHRIETYRNRQPANDLAAASDRSIPAIPFVTDADGIVRAVDAPHRGAFVGVSLHQLGQLDHPGVDAGVARAFARRDHIVGGRLRMVLGTGAQALWTIEAEPRFDTPSGRFTGYAGSLRPLDRHAAATDAPIVSRPLAEAMRQMIHELRSPLNAISGFGQMIAGQYFGEAPEHYRLLATSIVADADRLTDIFSDLDLASVLDMQTFAASGEATPLSSAVDGMTQAVRQAIGPDVTIDTSRQSGSIDDLAEVAVGYGDLQRLVSLLCRGIRQRIGSDGAVAMTIMPSREGLSLTLAFSPVVDDMQGADTASAIDPLSLASRLADRLGCGLRVDAGKAILNFPLLIGNDGRVDRIG